MSRFTIGVYISGGGYTSDPSDWERQYFTDAGWGLQGIPINVVLPYWLGSMPIEQTRVLLDVLSSHGVQFLATGNAFANGSWTRMPFSIAHEAYVRALAQHPAALGIYIADEPVGALRVETEQHHQQIKSWAPNLLTLNVLMAGVPQGEQVVDDPARWVNSADILGVDPYPLYGPEPAAGYAHFTVADYVSKLRAVVPAERPVWAVLQLFKFTSDSRLPTPEEMRAHAIMAIVEGAQGILWWDIGVNGLRQLNGATVSTYMGHLRELVTELAGLEPALVAEDVSHLLVNSTTYPDPVTGRLVQLQHNVGADFLWSRKEWYQAEAAAIRAGDHSRSGGMLRRAAAIRTRATIAMGAGYVFAYNYTNQPQPVRFTVPGARLFDVRESRTGQNFQDGPNTWGDTFGPYQARIYVIHGEAA